MKRTQLTTILLGFGSITLWGAVQPLNGAQTIADNMPNFAKAASNLGAVAPATSIDVTLWLKPHNREEMDALAKEVTNPASPNFRHFLTREQWAARYAPTAEEAATVQNFLTSHQLNMVRTGPDHFYVRATGTAANVSSAFHVEIHNFQVNGQVVRGNVNPPSIEGPAGALVSAIYGLDNLNYSHPYVKQSSMLQRSMSQVGALATNGAMSTAVGASSSAAKTPAAPPDSSFFTKNCFSTAHNTGKFSADGITLKYNGNVYNPTNNSYGCGYTPAEIRTAYNLNALYQEGYDGTGQTIVIVDFCGSPTITADANAFSARFGLPALTAKNFQIINYPKKSTCSAPDIEINLDVEWAHTIAPGAKIDLVIAPSANINDTDEAVFHAIMNGLGNVISNSYGAEEALLPPALLSIEDLINEAAALLGISNNFASGDSGDFTTTAPFVQSVLAPASSPYATAVGGVTLALNSDNTLAAQAGWGNNVDELIQEGFIFDPVPQGGFAGGSGGGPSGYFAKPLYQASLPGPARQLPDISWLADPFTGVVIAISNPGVYPALNYEVIGGTSLACPMFSALWAIANQEASGAPLGQAAPILYSMPAATISDIVPVFTATNVTVKETDSNGTTPYSADYLASPLENTTEYYSAFWNPGDAQLVVSFGTDTSLTIMPGWDNVTGLGVPNAKAFADYFKQF